MRIITKPTVALTALLLSAFSSAASAFELPPGWSAGNPEAPAPVVTPDEPACCALGLMHPCCAPQKRIDAQEPPTVGDVDVVDVDALPTVDLQPCAVEAPRARELPPATDEASAHGLRIYGEGKPGPIPRLTVGDRVRLTPMGRAGAIRADNAGFWSAGDRGAFTPRRGDALTFGVSYNYGAPWQRVDRLVFESLVPVDEGFRFRFFDGSLDIVTGRVGATCSYEAPLAALLDGWMYAFVGQHDQGRELHVVVPAGEDVLSSGEKLSFGQVFERFVLPLDETSAAALRTSAFTWSRVQDGIAEPHWFGGLSAHVFVAEGMDTPSVLVARER